MEGVAVVNGPPHVESEVAAEKARKTPPFSPLTIVSEPQSLFASVSRAPSRSATLGAMSTKILMDLQTMAMTGPPATRDNRVKRQALARKLALSPGLYSRMVFGEAPETTTATESSPDAQVADPPLPST